MGYADDGAGHGSDEGEEQEVTENENKLRAWAALEGNNELTAALEELFARNRELESALNWQTDCLSCARVLSSSIKDAERVDKFRQEVIDLNRHIEAMRKSQLRANERLRLMHRRAVTAESRLHRYEISKVRVTDHTFETHAEHPDLCGATLFGQVCMMEAEFHELVDPEDVKPPLAQWEKHVMEYGAPPEAHWYLSTACHHLRHDKCRMTCKFCPEPCSCMCHQAPETD